jgi:hypothetical protein
MAGFTANDTNILPPLDGAGREIKIGRYVDWRQVHFTIEEMYLAITKEGYSWSIVCKDQNNNYVDRRPSEVLVNDYYNARLLDGEFYQEKE